MLALVNYFRPFKRKKAVDSIPFPAFNLARKTALFLFSLASHDRGDKKKFWVKDPTMCSIYWARVNRGRVQGM